MLGSGHRLREEDARHGSLERHSSDGRLTVDAAAVYPNLSLTSPWTASEQPPASGDIVQSKNSPESLFFCSRMPAVQEEYEPPLRKSLFDNVPPFLNYLPNGLHGRYEGYLIKDIIMVLMVLARQPHVRNTRTTWWSSATASGESPWPSMPWSLL